MINVLGENHENKHSRQVFACIVLWGGGAAEYLKTFLHLSTTYENATKEISGLASANQVGIHGIVVTTVST